MEFKILQRITILLFTVLFMISCDDTVDSIGETIQPEGDGISLGVDTVYLAAETVSLNDRMYIRPKAGLVGEINDPVFGDLKADFLGELFSSGTSGFEQGYDGKATVDSVRFSASFFPEDFMGDSITPMGISVYEVNKPLEGNFYTDIEPSNYCDKSILLGRRFFTNKELPLITYTDANSNAIIYKSLAIDVNKKFGEDLYELWKKDPTILVKPENLRKYTNGIYVTADFENKSIVELQGSQIDIYYSYKLKDTEGEDSIVARKYPLPVADDMIQMNRVKNTPMEEIVGYGQNKVKSFIKSPAGVATKITVPLGRIREKAKKKTNTDKYIINTASVKFWGMTEEEKNLAITKRPEALLMINPDSLENFFLKQELPGAKSSIVLLRDASNNSYNFALQNSIVASISNSVVTGSNSSYASNNISYLINYFLAHEDLKDLEFIDFLLIPVEYTYSSSSSSSNSSISITGVSNKLAPTAGILRTNDEYLKMSLVFSKHNAD